MIATDHFVFLHLHKSGGSFVNEAIRRHVPGAREIGYHLPRSLIPPELLTRPVIGLVRNPWSYYVSWYTFQRQRPQPNALFRVLSNAGQLDFNATIHNMLDLGQNDTLLSQLTELLPRDYGSRGLNLPGFALAPIRASGLGFYSYLYQYMYAGTGGDLRIGRMEDLPAALLELFGHSGQPVGDALRGYLRTAPPLNSSGHAPYGSFYDRALQDRVASLDATVIGQHDYHFAAG
jgi:hypothetical protein